MPLGEKSDFLINWERDKNGNLKAYKIDLRPIYNYKEDEDIKQLNLFDEVNYGRDKQKEN